MKTERAKLLGVRKEKAPHDTSCNYENNYYGDQNCISSEVSSAVAGEKQSLALYHRQACPYCRITRKVINELDLNIELRDIELNSQFREELIKGGGKQQVPCLQIQNSAGDVEWLYESADIIQYLRQVGAKRQSAA